MKPAKIVLYISTLLPLFFILSQIATSQDTMNYARMKEYAARIQPILDDKGLTDEDKVKALLSLSENSQDKDFTALTYIYCINLLESAGDTAKAIYYNQLLQEIDTSNESILFAKKMFAGMEDRMREAEARFSSLVNDILSNDDDYEKTNVLLRSFDQILKRNANALIDCIKSVKDDTIRSKIAFIVFVQIYDRDSPDNIHGHLKDILLENTTSTYAHRYFALLNSEPKSKEKLDEVAMKIWGTDHISAKTTSKLVVQFAIGLSQKQAFWPPLLSPSDEEQFKHKLQEIGNSYDIVDRAIEFISQSNKSFIRDNANCSGVELALLLKTKLPVLKEYPPLRGKPIQTMKYLMQSTEEIILGGFSGHVSHNPYTVVMEDGAQQELFDWVIQNMPLVESDVMLIKGSDYAKRIGDRSITNQ